MTWTRNPGRVPDDAKGRRVRVKLFNGREPKESWPADGKGACKWKITGSDFDIEFYKVES